MVCVASHVLCSIKQALFDFSRSSTFIAHKSIKQTTTKLMFDLVYSVIEYPIRTFGFNLFENMYKFCLFSK